MLKKNFVILKAEEEDTIAAKQVIDFIDNLLEGCTSNDVCIEDENGYKTTVSKKDIELLEKVGNRLEDWFL